MKGKSAKNRSAKKPTAAKKPTRRMLQRQRLAKDDFGERLLKLKGSTDPETDLEF